MQPHPTEMVRGFHALFGAPIGTEPQLLPKARADFRLTLIHEERDELVTALASGDVADAAHELADLVYVICGMALEMGVTLPNPTSPPADHPTLADRGLIGYWLDVIDGHRFHLRLALIHADLTGATVRLAALLEACFGMAAAARIALPAVLTEVHAANMRKAGPDGKPVFRADGKLIKPPGFVPANVAAALGLVRA